MMLRSSIKTSGAFRAIQRGFIRHESTSGTATGVSSKAKASDGKRNGKPGRRATQDLYDIINAEYTEFSPLFDKFDAKVRSDMENQYVKPGHFVAIGNILLLKVLAIKNTNSIDVPDHILFERVIKTLIDNKVINASHFNRYLAALLQDKKYSKALTSWVDNLQYFKDHPETLKSVKKVNGVEKSYDLMSDLQFLGLASYFLSLRESANKVDKDFVQLITDNQPIRKYSFERYLNFIRLPKEDIEYINTQLNDYSKQLFDINGENHLKYISSLGHNNLLLKLENVCDSTLQKYGKKPEAIKPATLIAYMKAFNGAKHSAKVMELWSWGQKNGVIGAKPEIDFWNQLLLAQLNLTTENKETTLKSVWALLNKESVPNSESYSIYIKVLMSLGKYSEIMTLLNTIKAKNSNLWNSELKCDMVQTLVLSKKFDEAITLFKVYSKEDGFNADAATYNMLFSKLLQRDNMDEASKLLDQMTHDKRVQPDIATWTSVINYFLKLSKEAELAESKILKHLLNVISTMKDSGINVNNVAIITVMANLLKNPETSETGFQMLLQMESNSKVKLNETGYTAIVTTFSNNGSVSDAITYYHKAIEAGVAPRPFLYNSILKGYYRYPNIKATRSFYENEILTVAKGRDPRYQPNAYTYYFMISQGIREDNREFIQFTIDEIAKLPNLFLGQQLPKILSALADNGYSFSETLAKRIA